MTQHSTMFNAIVVLAFLMLLCVVVAAGLVIAISWLITGGALLWWLP